MPNSDLWLAALRRSKLHATSIFLNADSLTTNHHHTLKPFDVENHSAQPIAMVVDPLSIAATSAVLAQLCFKARRPILSLPTSFLC
jgi:hypothetical protein